MKRIASISIVALTLIALGAFGLTRSGTENDHSCNGGPEEKAEHKAEKMAEVLDLSDEQEEELQSILVEHIEKMQAQHKEAKGEEGHELDKGEMKRMREEVHEEIAGILNEEQKEKFQEHREKKRAQREHHRKMKKAHEELKPEMKKKRAAFDEELSEDEKESLADVREQLPEGFSPCPFEGASCKKGGMKGCKASCDKKGKEGCCKGGEGKECEHGHGKGHGHHGKGHGGHKMGMHGKKGAPHGMKKKLRPVHKIAQNHKEELKDIFQEMHGKMKERVGEAPHSGCKHGKKGKGHKEGHRFKRMSTCFLLMDPGEASEGPEVNLAPNPAESEVRVEYELVENGHVTVEMRDQNGTLLEAIEEGEREAGTHDLIINLEQYNTEDYYLIKVRTDQGSSTEKLMKTK